MGMADERDGFRSSRVDLNLNPGSHCLRSLELEPNLAISPPTTEENHTSFDMANDIEPTNSPASFTREPANPPIDRNAWINGNSNQERCPPSIDHPLPTARENPPYSTPSYNTQQEMDDETELPLPLCTLSPFFMQDGSLSPLDVSPLETVVQHFATNGVAWPGRDESPTYRFESRNRYRGLRRFHSYHGSERSDFRGADSPDISQGALESSGKKHRVQAEGIEMESLEEKKEEKSNNAANFECNICFDMAQEPVVTSCGHLFCWPCLYQWLHVHSEYKTCPVCKGEVIKSNITPIYGRGSSEPSGAENFAECGESDIKIPPRPHGNRFENLRMQSPPIYRRLRNGSNRFEGHEVYHAAFTRLRERIFPREEWNTEFGLSDSATISLGHDAHSLFSDGNSFWDRLRDSTSIPLSSDTNPHFSYGVDDRLQADLTISLQSSDTNPSLRDGLDDWHWFQSDRTELQHQSSVNGGLYDGNGYEDSTSSVNPPTNFEHLIRSANVAFDSTSDLVSVSSSMSMIVGDFDHPEGFISTQ